MAESPMILVVASHPDIREAILPLVRAKGYEVAAIDCGDEVLNRLRFQSPSVVILDCGVADSFELLAKIRAEPHARSTPVVMFSADDQDIRRKALLKGADAYVPKGSLDWVELIAEIKRFAGAPPLSAGAKRSK
jgi:two-component system OmpR family response regulator